MCKTNSKPLYTDVKVLILNPAMFWYLDGWIMAIIFKP